MKGFVFVLVVVLGLVAAWQFVQRQDNDRVLREMQSATEQLPQMGRDIPELLPDSRNRVVRDPAVGESDREVEEQLIVADSWSALGSQQGAGMRRLMALRDQLPEDGRPSLDQLLTLVMQGGEKQMDPQLLQDFISEAELLMRSMMTFMTNRTPSEMTAIQRGDTPITGVFGAGFVRGALGLGMDLDSALVRAFEQEEEEGNQALKALLSPNDYRTLIELAKGCRYEEMPLDQRQDPVDLIGRFKSMF